MILTYSRIGKKRGEKVSDDEEDEEVSDHVPSSIKPFKHSRPGFTIHNDASELEEDTDDTAEEEEDTFIVEDGNAAPLELPAEFSMSTYQDLTHHFKVICQLFVHLAVQEKEDRAVFMEEMYKGNGSPPSYIRFHQLNLFRAILFGASSDSPQKDRRYQRFRSCLVGMAYRIQEIIANLPDI